MNSAYRHLVWKEYRAIRAFWLALVVLSLGLQFFVSLVFSDSRMIVFNVALATPVFFAVGCIGTAFAIEKEDGSYDWLRASPATDLQVFIGKVGLCIVATLAMFAVLWPIAIWKTEGRIPTPEVFHGMLALWLLAAVEAIAWGTLFSLRFERPLPAILLALVVTSVVIQLAAMPYATVSFNFDRFLYAVPFRLVVIAPVLFYDVYLGLRWLQGEETRQSPRKRQIAPTKSRTATKAETNLAVASHLHTRDRGMLLSHLFWQHARQSWRLMLLLVGLQLAVTLFIQFLGIDKDNLLTILPLVGFAALMGSSVFLPDQERRNYRYFAEHNVPPRYVWLTRLLPWMVVAFLSCLMTALFWIGSEVLGKLVMMFLWGLHAAGSSRGPGRYFFNDFFQLPPVSIGIVAAALAFAAGQWLSMHVRSGLLAGFFSLLAAALLTIWVGCVVVGGLSWLVFLVPIFFVLVWATWLRAPDWTLENATWRARTKAAAVAIVPVLALLTLAPFMRIHQISTTPLPFSPAAFVAEITPEGLENGQLYRRANELMVNRWAPVQETFVGGQRKTQYMTKAEYLAANTEPLQLILKATTLEPSFQANPQTLSHWLVVDEWTLNSLVIASGRHLEQQGKLGEALDRYFATFTVQRQLSDHAPRMWNNFDEPGRETFRCLTSWSAQKGQTPDRTRRAIHRLQNLGDAVNAEDGIKSDYILCQRFLNLDQRVFGLFGEPDGSLSTSSLVQLRLMPWERTREQRELDQVVNGRLRALQHVQSAMQAGQDVWLWADRYRAEDYNSPLRVASRFSNWSNAAICDTIAFEANRRATQLVLAAQAYRLQHGQLPESLEEHSVDLLNFTPLAGAPFNVTEKLGQSLVDPYTGRPFIYFPRGISRPPHGIADHLEQSGYWKRDRMAFDLPCLWSPGPDLQSNVHESESSSAKEIYYTARESYFNYGDHVTRPLATYQAWGRGLWFPIPTPSAAANVTDPETAPDSSQ
jgi:hypothetical protein